MTFKKSKNMIYLWNVYCYGGRIPKNISAYRWAAMCKFFENNS